MCDIILQNTYLDLLPHEILCMIITQIDDIDIKRHFDCYNKINLEKYNFLSYVFIDLPIDVNNQWMVCTLYNYKKNLYDNIERKKFKVPDDHILLNHSVEKTYIIIHRLVLKNKTPDGYIHKLEDSYKQSSALITNSLKPPPYLYGSLSDYKWEIIKTIKEDKNYCK